MGQKNKASLSVADSEVLEGYRSITKLKKLKAWSTRSAGFLLKHKDKSRSEILRDVLFAYKQMIEGKGR